jgi:hypothetical protein
MFSLGISFVITALIGRFSFSLSLSLSLSLRAAQPIDLNDDAKRSGGCNGCYS